MKSSISTGTSVTDKKAAAAIEKVLVHASGANSRPSCASSVNTGRKEMVMMSRLKNSAGPTSRQAAMMAEALASAINNCWLPLSPAPLPPGERGA